MDASFRAQVSQDLEICRQAAPCREVRCGVEEWAWADSEGQWLEKGNRLGRAQRRGGEDLAASGGGWIASIWRGCLGGGSGGGLRGWVGARRLPHLAGSWGWGGRWLSILCTRADERLWSIEQCVRCAAISTVIADGRGLDFTATRRLQLAVESRRTPVKLVLLRAADELARPSAARVRGVVWPRPSKDGVVRWNAQLLRRKGVRPADDLGEGDRVVLEVRRGEVVVVHQPADVADRPAAAEKRAGAGAALSARIRSA